MSTDNGLALRAEPAPTRENGRVAPPRRRKNTDSRTREYLSPKEVHSLQCAAGRLGRHGQRDAALVLIGYRHGLRVSELAALRWEQVDFKAGLLHVARLKNGIASTHPIQGPELRSLHELRRRYPDGPYVFCSEHGGPLGVRSVRAIVARAGVEAKLPFTVHPHMLRHSTGYKLANDGQDTRAIQLYLGHRSITHTVRYTELSPERFKDFWRD